MRLDGVAPEQDCFGIKSCGIQTYGCNKANKNDNDMENYMTNELLTRSRWKGRKKEKANSVAWHKICDAAGIHRDVAVVEVSVPFPCANLPHMALALQLVLNTQKSPSPPVELLVVISDHSHIVPHIFSRNSSVCTSAGCVGLCCYYCRTTASISMFTYRPILRFLCSSAIPAPHWLIVGHFFTMTWPHCYIEPQCFVSWDAARAFAALGT